MRFTWGTGIAIVMGAFIALMAWFMVRAANNQEQLVAEDYYERELRFQERIESTRRASELEEHACLELVGQLLVVTIPADGRGEGLTGSISLGRPSDQRADAVFPLALDSTGVCRIDLSGRLKGAYNVSVDWSVAGKDYYAEDRIHLQ